MDFLRLGKDPIQPDQPAGAEIRYSPEYEALQAEMDKLSLPRLAGTMDWEKVVGQASALLADKSKDLLVASYLALALVYTKKVEGLITGLKIYRDLMENFWETLFPAKNRIRARVRAVEWWLEKTETALKALGSVSLSPEQTSSLQADMAKIDEILRQNTEEAPSLHVLQEFLNSLAVSGDEAPAEPPPPSAQSKPPAGEPKTTKEEKSDAAEALSSPGDAQKVFNLGLQRVREAANFLAGSNPADPGSYRWARMAAWAAVEGLPPHTDGRTRIPPPPEAIRRVLTDLRNKGDWQTLLKSSQEKLSQFIFWIDLNRWAAEALNGLGPSYQAAGEAVCRETAFLLCRLPGLENLAFSDGTPFADEATKGWLKGIGLQSGSPAGGSLPATGPAAGEDGGEMEKEVEKAQKLIREGKLPEALGGLQQKLKAAVSRKEKLLWQLWAAQLLLNAGKPRLARPYLEQILKDVDFYQTETWDPELALRCLKAVLSGFQLMPEPSLKEAAKEILNRIAKLDLNEAIRLGLG